MYKAKKTEKYNLIRNFSYIKCEQNVQAALLYIFYYFFIIAETNKKYYQPLNNKGAQTFTINIFFFMQVYIKYLRNT